MKTKIYSFILIGALSLCKAQTPELLYYKFESSAVDIPNLATNPPAGSANAQIVGNLTLSGNTSCLMNGLAGKSTTASSNYLNTNWNLSLSGSWTMHMKFNNYTSTDTAVYYLLGDSTSAFRMLTNGIATSGGVNNIKLFSTGLTTVVITNVFPASSPVDVIIVYDNTAQKVRAYVNGVLNSTTSQAAPFVFNGGNFRLGGYGGGGIGMKNGMIMDEFGLFNRVITDAEIASLSSSCASLSTQETIKNSRVKIAVQKDRLILEKGNFEKYRIYDYSGRTVLSGNEASNSIDLSSLSRGNYIIEFGKISIKFKY